VIHASTGDEHRMEADEAPEQGSILMGSKTNWILALVIAASALVVVPPAADAQQQRSTRQAAKAKAGSADGGTTDGQLKARVDQLEEQLTDMQVMVGTLESLGRGGQAGASPVAAGSGVDNARVDSLETQIRALASQVQQLSEQVRQLSGNRRGQIDLPAAPGGFAPAPAYPQAHNQAAASPPAPIQGFGSTTVNPGATDPIGRLLKPNQPQNVSASPAAGLPPQAASAANPRELYETAYGYLLQQDYGAAEVAFDEFLRRYSSDRLAADAQYWLGETLYVQRRYKPAGQAFLAVIEKHKGSSKVPNSLLKLAQSLEQLGQKDCGIFTELETRHANAPADVRVKARALKRRQGC
jgi:tol-pal system protein YbgF